MAYQGHDPFRRDVRRADRASWQPKLAQRLSRPPARPCPARSCISVEDRHQSFAGMGGRIRAAGTINLMITMQDTGNPNAAQQAFQIKNKMAAMPFVAVPEFLRRAAGRAPIRVMVLGALGSQGLAAPDALGAGLLARLARRAGCRSNPGCSRTFQRIAQTAAARPASRWNSTKGAIRRWRPRRVCRVLRQTLRKFDRHRVQSAKKFNPRRWVKGLEECAIHCRKIDGWLVRHAGK